MVRPHRFEVWWCSLDPTVGHEIAKAGPVVVVSPDEANDVVPWFIVAPIITGQLPYASRIPTQFDGRPAVIVVDQLRCVDRGRLSRRMGVLDPDAQVRLLQALAAFFAP